MSATPGPWTARINNFNRWEILGGAGQIASVSTPFDPASPPKDWSECETNARLIASAPDLLAALQCLADAADIAGWSANIGTMDDAIFAARDAIARATGAP